MKRVILLESQQQPKTFSPDWKDASYKTQTIWCQSEQSSRITVTLPQTFLLFQQFMIQRELPEKHPNTHCQSVSEPMLTLLWRQTFLNLTTLSRLSNLNSCSLEFLLNRREWCVCCLLFSLLHRSAAVIRRHSLTDLILTFLSVDDRKAE